MNRHLLAIALLSAFALSACAALNGGMSTLNSALTSVSALSSSIGQFTSSLQGMPGQEQIQQIAGFSAQAGKLADTLEEATSMVPTSAADGVTKVQNLLGNLTDGSFSVESLQSLAPAGLTEKINGLASLGTGLGTAANEALNALGQ